MGSEVQLERFMPGYCSTMELGEEVSSQSWNYYDRQFHDASVDLDSDCYKDRLKQKMVEHDAVFRRQVSELHRLYRTQRDLMGEMKRSELYGLRRPLSLTPLVYQRQDTSKLYLPNFVSSNSACTSPSILGADHATPNLSHLKRKAPKTDLVTVIDVDDSKDCEIIECRPGKARRQIFDLQLSADAYIDRYELHQSRNDQSFFGGHSRRTSNVNGMKNLNEPIQIEDDPSTIDFMNQKPSLDGFYSKHFSLQTPPKNYSREASFNPRYGGEYIDSQMQLIADRESNRAQSSHLPSLGFNTKAATLSQHLIPERSQHSQLVHGKNGTSYGTLISALPNQRKDIKLYSPKFAEAGHEPRIFGPNHPSDVKCWPPPVTFLEKKGCESMKKQPCFISSSVRLSNRSQESNQPSMLFREKLNINSSYVVGIPQINEFNHGSSSGSKEESICYPSVKFENHDGGADNAGPKYPIGLKGIDLNCCGEMELSAHHETAKMEESNHASLLPWMKPKPVRSDSAQEKFSKTSNKFLNSIERGNVDSQSPPRIFTGSASGDHGVGLKKTTTDHTSKKIHGFPAFAQPLAAGSFRLSKERKLHVLDLKVSCETEPIMEENADKKDTGFKNFFDLNSCLTEDETSPHSASSVLGNIRGIDLEAPAPHEIDELVTQETPLEAEFERRAVEAMVSFSSLKSSNIIESASIDATETLKWFVDVVSSCPSDSEQQSYEYPEESLMRTSSDETDYFEQMTVSLTEMTTQEHMPKNAFPTISIVEEEPVNVITSGTRPRRGQIRRGRPKRDFQRNILPDLTSLSRHEVTEDMQAFDGLMRSSGHSWQFGKRAAARNKPRRGRPRTVNVITPVPDPIHIHVCIRESIENRSLTGWGKTTRRPRRQRCPAGNSQHVRLI